MKFDSDIEYQFLRTLSLLIPMLGELLGLFDLFFRDTVFFYMRFHRRLFAILLFCSARPSLYC
jgi:hypothetical protein